MATFQNTLHVSEHSADGKLYGYLNFDGKLKIWDTETSELKREYVPKLHLTVPFTCFTWITVDRLAAANKKSPKKSQQTTQYVALGTRNGGVSLYSFSEGEIECNLKGDGHAGCITAICRGANNNLFTCGDDCRVIEWDLKTGAQKTSWEIGSEKPSSLVYLAESNRLLVAGRQLNLWSVEKQELEQTFTGHSTNVTILKYLVVKSKEFVLSASKTDRVLSLWRMKPAKNRPSTYSYLMEDIAFDVSYKIEESGEFKIAAVTRSGVLHLYEVDGLAKGSDETASKPSKPTVTLEVANDSAQTVEPIPICTASMQLTRAHVKIGYGDRQVLRFEQIEPDYNVRRQVLTRESVKKSLGESANARKRAAAASKTVTPIIDMNNVEIHAKGTPSRKGLKTTEIPMETRLENLAFDSISLSSSKQQGRNIAQLLVQALHRRDGTLLREAFSNQDEQLIRATLKRLPPQYIGSLIAELTALAQKKTTNVHTAIIWVKILLQTQSSQLMAIGSNELFTTFGPLLGIAEHRANTFQQLTKLSGRLDLLLSQIKQNTDQDIVEDTDLVVYEDKDSSESDGIPGDESSDDQWEDDEAEENDIDLENSSPNAEEMEVCENGDDESDDDEQEDDEEEDSE